MTKRSFSLGLRRQADWRTEGLVSNARGIGVLRIGLNLIFVRYLLSRWQGDRLGPHLIALYLISEKDSK